jgi:beta-glucanase (GH16 family)
MVTTGRPVDDHRVPAGLLVRHGIVEMRARLPAGAGLWPAFWMLPETHESRPEIDIMEVNGRRPRVLSVHLHTLLRGERASLGERCTYGDLSQDWHVYSVEWNRHNLVWYLDGQKCWEVNDAASVPAEPMYILINLAVGGDYVGPPDDTTVFPATLEVDWVRVWQRGGGA